MQILINVKLIKVIVNCASLWRFHLFFYTNLGIESLMFSANGKMSLKYCTCTVLLVNCTSNQSVIIKSQLNSWVQVFESCFEEKKEWLGAPAEERYRSSRTDEQKTWEKEEALKQKEQALRRKMSWNQETNGTLCDLGGKVPP